MCYFKRDMWKGGDEATARSKKDRLLKFTAFPNGRDSPVVDWKWQ